MLFTYCLGVFVLCTKRTIRGRLFIAVFFATSTFCYLVLIQLLNKIQILNRGTCCLSADLLEDICGRPNCTWPTCSHQSSYSLREIKSSHDYDRAFFIETSGSATLNIRQACAVESLALHNPNLTVNVLLMGGEINTSLPSTLAKLKEKYENIQLIGVSLVDYMTGTPLEYWFHCNSWRDGPFHVSHMSDGLRFLTLYKYGGYYFDLDVISVRPVTDLHNFVAAESDDYLGSGVIHADFKNPVMELAVKDFVANYRSDVWGHNGPALLLRVLKLWCKAKDLLRMDYVSCRGFNVLHYSSFCPVDYMETEELFTHRSVNESGKPIWLTDQVVGVHTWNKLTHSKPIYKNSTQHYTWLARTNWIWKTVLQYSILHLKYFSMEICIVTFNYKWFAK